MNSALRSKYNDGDTWRIKYPGLPSSRLGALVSRSGRRASRPRRRSRCRLSRRRPPRSRPAPPSAGLARVLARRRPARRPPRPRRRRAGASAIARDRAPLSTRGRRLDADAPAPPRVLRRRPALRRRHAAADPARGRRRGRGRAHRGVPGPGRPRGPFGSSSPWPIPSRDRSRSIAPLRLGPPLLPPLPLLPQRLQPARGRRPGGDQRRRLPLRHLPGPDRDLPRRERDAARVFPPPLRRRRRRGKRLLRVRLLHRPRGRRRGNRRRGNRRRPLLAVRRVLVHLVRPRAPPGRLAVPRRRRPLHRRVHRDAGPRRADALAEGAHQGPGRAADDQAVHQVPHLRRRRRAERRHRGGAGALRRPRRGSRRGEPSRTTPPSSPRSSRGRWRWRGWRTR